MLLRCNGRQSIGVTVARLGAASARRRAAALRAAPSEAPLKVELLPVVGSRCVLIVLLLLLVLPWLSPLRGPHCRVRTVADARAVGTGAPAVIVVVVGGVRADSAEVGTVATLLLLKGQLLALTGGTIDRRWGRV